jgi:NTE family protein
VHEWFQASRVEELLIPTAIVTTDLDTGAPYVFTRGPLEVAIRASCAFPGLFKPVEYEGRLLADGCIAAPVPTAVAARMNARCVLGVAVGWREKSAPSGCNVVQVFDRTFRTSSKRMQQPSWVRNADVLLEPEVQQIDWNDFSRVDEARAAGAEAMRRALPHVRKLLDRQSQPRPVAGTSGPVESWLVS